MHQAYHDFTITNELVKPCLICNSSSRKGYSLLQPFSFARSMREGSDFSSLSIHYYQLETWDEYLTETRIIEVICPHMQER